MTKFRLTLSVTFTKKNDLMGGYYDFVREHTVTVPLKHGPAKILKREHGLIFQELDKQRPDACPKDYEIESAVAV